MVTGSMRVLIADDNELVRRGIAPVLSGENELEVCVGEASDADETLNKADELKSSLILLDVSMPGTNGLEYSAPFKGRVSGGQNSNHQPAQS